ncbi:MAG: O-antigen ligase family protein [Bryobacteraceae bacterium]|jgi:O-antigen ligase
MNILALIVLGATLGYACFEHAGVEPESWIPCLVAIGAIGALYFLFPRRERTPRPDRIAAIAGYAVLAVAAFQVAPLPAGLVRALSPARWELMRATEPVAGAPPRWMALSAAPYVSAQWALTLAGFLVVFLIVRDLAARLRHHPWAALWPLLIVVGLEALLGFYQSYGGGGTSEATGTYNSRDHFAGLLEMVLPFAAMYALAILQRDREPHRWPAAQAVKACAMLAIAALILVGIVFSLSRMGFFCALAALFVCGTLTLGARNWRMDDVVAAPLWRRMLPMALVAVVALLGFVFLPTDPLIARFSDFAHMDNETPDTRAQLWRDTGLLIRDYPVFGCGLGAYESCFLRYKTVAPMNTADFAHNDYVQVLAELGLVGFAAGFVFVFRILARAGRSVLYARSIDRRYRAIACVAAFTCILLHSFVDFNMYIQANAFTFAWIAGVASSDMAGPSGPSREAATAEPEVDSLTPGAAR